MFFSVVIPLYNKEKEISNTLQSLVLQTFKDFEVIIINDGSTDAGEEVVKQVKDDRIKILNQMNQGVSVARNLGINTAVGEYVVFLDADDICKPEHLDVLFQLIRDNPEQVVFSTGYQVKENNMFLSVPTSFEKGFSGTVQNPFLHLSKGLSLLNSSTTCVRRNVLTKNFLFPPGVARGEDLHLWIRLINEFGICHSSRRTIIINRDALERSVSNKIINIPAHFMIIVELFKNDIVKYQHRKGLKLFFLKSGLATAAGSKMSGQKDFTYKLAHFCFSNKFYKQGIIISFIYIIPNFVFCILRKMRNRKIA